MSGAVEVRRATVADAAGIAHVQTVSWREAYAGLLPADFLANRVVTGDEWQERLTNLGSNHFVHVAVRESEMIGFAAAGPSLEEAVEGDSTPWLYAIYVLADWWGKGVGFRLYQAVLTDFEIAGYTEAVLWVLVGNERAETFYLRQGWTDDHFIRDETMDGQVLHVRRFRLRPLQGRP
jgi:GNAT superfamily N-acetyltransferase